MFDAVVSWFIIQWHSKTAQKVNVCAIDTIKTIVSNYTVTMYEIVSLSIVYSVKHFDEYNSCILCLFLVESRSSWFLSRTVLIRHVGTSSTSHQGQQPSSKRQARTSE